MREASTIRDLRPLLKGETLKKWLGDILENESGGAFQNSLKKGNSFSNYFEKRIHFQTVFEKNTPPGGQGPGGPGPGPRTQAPTGWGIFVKLSLKMDPFLKIV